MDTLTVLYSLQKDSVATKQFRKVDGEIKSIPYSNVKLFDAETVSVDGLESLSKNLEKLSTDLKRYIIRGGLRAGVDPRGVRRPDRGLSEGLRESFFNR